MKIATKTTENDHGFEKQPKSKAALNFEKWMKKEFGDLDVEIKLYRKEKSGSRERKVFKASYLNDNPKETEIGENFGGGDFVLWAEHPETGEIYTKLIFLGPEWDKIAEDKAKETAELTAPAKVIPSNNIDQGAMFESLLDKVVSLVEKVTPKGQPQQAQGSDYYAKAFEEIGSSYAKGLTKMGTTMIEKNIATMDKISDGDQNLNEEQKETKDDVIDLIVRFGNMILNSKGDETKAYKKLLSEDDKFKKFKDDKILFSAIYTDMCQNKNIGKKYADELFKKIGFKVPNA